MNDLTRRNPVDPLAVVAGFGELDLSARLTLAILVLALVGRTPRRIAGLAVLLLCALQLLCLLRAPVAWMPAASAQADITSTAFAKPCCASTCPLGCSSSASSALASDTNCRWS